MAVKRTAPARVDSVEKYWDHPPPERSDRCAWWVVRIRDGWRRNRRLRVMGFHESAAYFGVYIWEWNNVLRPMIVHFEEEEGSAA